MGPEGAGHSKVGAEGLKIISTRPSQEHLAERRRRLVVVAALSFDRDVDQLIMLAKKSAIGPARPRLMSHDGNNRGEFAAANLPDMQIGHNRVVIAFDG